MCIQILEKYRFWNVKKKQVDTKQYRKTRQKIILNVGTLI